MAEPEKIRITLKRSHITQIQKHRATLQALGLRRPNRSVVKPNSPVVRGMVDSVDFMVDVEPADD
jgi:large subunit ribosomal protein L30